MDLYRDRPWTHYTVVFRSIHGSTPRVASDVMSFVVVPFSAAPTSPKDVLWVALSILVHVALVGIPIAFGTHFALRAPTAQ